MLPSAIHRGALDGAGGGAAGALRPVPAPTAALLRNRRRAHVPGLHLRSAALPRGCRRSSRACGVRAGGHLGLVVVSSGLCRRMAGRRKSWQSVARMIGFLPEYRLASPGPIYATRWPGVSPAICLGSPCGVPRDSSLATCLPSDLVRLRLLPSRRPTWCCPGEAAPSISRAPRLLAGRQYLERDCGGCETRTTGDEGG
jgi:hypothetical protein